MQPTKMSSITNPKHLYIVEFAFANVVQPTFDKSDAKDFLLSVEWWKPLDHRIWRWKDDEK